MSRKKLLFVTGSRGEWGYIRPILRLCKQRDDVDYSLCVTNMHLLPDFGLSVKEIEKDGFRIDHKIYMALDGYNHTTMVKSLGILICSLADVVANEKPDWIVLAGDRGEQLAGAIVGAYCYIPIAHIQAGELSGNIDGMTRHAIGKYAHMHLASNEDAATRLRKLGEEAFRIHNVGAPQLDELAQGECNSLGELEKKYAINLGKGYLLLVQHPVTEEFEDAGRQIAITMAAINRIELPKIVILPNNDAGSSLVRDGIENNRQGEYHVFSNLKREEYLGFLKHASCMVGNSSSGLLEAPTFKVPAVNIGRRQHQRVAGVNVIHVPCDTEAIVAGIHKGLSADFKAYLATACVNPYGDGQSSGRILDILVQTPVTDALLVKNLTY